jgi:hypothetical protein
MEFALVEAKSAYALIDYWPSSYRDDKLAFDKAIEGWNLTLEVWEIVIDNPNISKDESTVVMLIDSSNKPLVDKLSKYGGVDISTTYSMTSKEWIGELMAKAGTYFEAGKAGVR